MYLLDFLQRVYVFIWQSKYYKDLLVQMKVSHVFLSERHREIVSFFSFVMCTYTHIRAF